MSLEEFETMCRKHEIAITYLATPKRERATAGTILQRCLYEVEKFRTKMTKSLCVFKLGLTTNPIIRFNFYKDANYSHMALLHVTENAGVAQMLEASLIAIHMSQTGCRNEKHGGECPPTCALEPFHFVYVVGARADSMKRIRWHHPCEIPKLNCSNDSLGALACQKKRHL